jgi:hypothetical protein
MKKTKSQIKILKVMLIVTVILFILPLSIYLTFMLTNKPLTKSKVPLDPTIIMTNNDKEVLIKSLINFKFTKPNNTWGYKINKEITNKYNRTKAIDMTITNGISKTNILVNETELQNQRSTGIDEKRLNTEITKNFMNYVRISESNKNLIKSTANYNLVRSDNLSESKGQIIVNTNDYKEENVDGNNKIIKYQSLINPFDNYSENFKQYQLESQFTYQEDTVENYKVLDNIIQSLQFNID